VRKIVLGAVASFLLGGSALAADLPVKAPVYKAPPIVLYNWTGIYVGGHGGYGWSHTDSTNVNGNPPEPAGTQTSSDQNGWLGGLQAGFNYEFPSHFLLGVEGDFSWSDLNGDSTESSVVPRFIGLRTSYMNTKINWMATATGRLGYAVNNWLFYAKGGAAWAHKEVNSTTVNPAAGNLLLATITGDDTRTGWTVGGGIEWGFWKNWSVKVEYDYLDFGTETESRSATYFNGASGLNPLLRDVDWHIHVVKVGLNYRFDWMH
jgi:outer membrane immunogenic protein